MAPSRDTLKPKQVVKETGWTRQYVAFLQSIPELWGLVQEAVNNDWFDSAVGQKKFKNRFESSQWFKDNAKSARGYLMAEAAGGADFERERETTRELIRARAMALGAALTDEALDSFTTAYYMNGWGEQGREGFLDRALAGELEGFETNHLDFQKGGPQAVINSLKKVARANGVRYNEDYFQSAARSVIAGLSTVADYEADIRSTAATADPRYADRIMAGEDRRAIYSPYLDVYARMFDRSADDVELDDPTFRTVFNKVDDKGNPVVMGLWDAEKEWRKSEGYQYTRDAHRRIAEVVSTVGRTLGFGG